MIRDSIVKSVHSYRSNIARICSELIQVDTSNPPGDCSKIIHILREQYKETGAIFHTISASRDVLKLDGMEYPRNNFVASFGGSGKVVGLSIGTHMDVVSAGDTSKWRYQPFSGKIAKGRIWGRGACDAKCSLVAQLYAIKALAECGLSLKRSLLMIGTVDDEAPGNKIWPGMKFVVDSGLKKLGIDLPRFAINAEASGLENVWGIFSGGATFGLAFRGRVGHPPVGINALMRAIEFWTKVSKSKEYGQTRLAWLSGGSATDLGLTPQIAELIFRTSIRKGVTTDSILRRVQDLLRVQSRNLPRTSVRIISREEPFDVGSNSPIVSAIRKSARFVGIRSFYGGGIVGAGDLYPFLEKGIPGVTYGAGKLERCHVPNEFVSVDEIVKQAEIYALTALELC